jgi:hypothetical protein
VKSAKYEYNNSKRELERLEIRISSLERTLNITGTTRDNVIKHTINKEEARSIHDVTNRGVNEADYAESVAEVVDANKEAESNFAAIDDIDKTLGLDIHQSKEDDEFVELERMRKQNQRDKAIAREDEEGTAAKTISMYVLKAFYLTGFAAEQDFFEQFYSRLEAAGNLFGLQ